MMGPLWWVRMARMVRNPPSRQRVIIVVTIVAIAAVIVLSDWLLNPNFGERPENHFRRGITIQAEPIEN